MGDRDGEDYTFIVGCGRSGTTLLFELLESTASTSVNTNVVKLDEPREVYMNFWGESFDIWSKLSEER